MKALLEATELEVDVCEVFQSPCGEVVMKVDMRAVRGCSVSKDGFSPLAGK